MTNPGLLACRGLLDRLYLAKLYRMIAKAKRMPDTQALTAFGDVYDKFVQFGIDPEVDSEMIDYNEWCNTKMSELSLQ